MRRLNICCELKYAMMGPASFIFNIEAAHHPDQHIIREALTVTPSEAVIPSEAANNGLDTSGHNRLVRFNTNSGEFSVRYDALVEVNYRRPSGREREIPVGDLPIEAIPYLWPSRYCESDVIATMAIRTFETVAPGYQRVEAICRWVRENIVYLIGSTNSTTTASDVLIGRAGVCRDFAHLAISFCRALNIPARMVTGYTWYPDPPPDFHAIFEVYLEHRWILFDATQLAPLSDVVRIATGKDASETAFATLFGPVKMTYSSPVASVVTDSGTANILATPTRPMTLAAAPPLSFRAGGG
jgi:transglutaminase-like putative cysteine protease